MDRWLRSRLCRINTPLIPYFPRDLPLDYYNDNTLS